MPELIRETRPRSRGKVHCEMCGITIPEGIAYRRATLVGDEHVYDYCSCDECEEVFSLAWLDIGEADGFDNDDIKEWAEEEITCNGLHVAQARAYLARRGIQIEERDHA